MFIKKATACLALMLALYMANAAQAADDTAVQMEQFYSQANQLRHEALQQNESCFSCHGKRDITSQWKTDRGRTSQLFVDPVVYRNSAHSGQSCQGCHEGDGEDAFARAPHKFKNKQPKDCQSCHDNYFKDIYEQNARSYHTKAIFEKGKPFPCFSCHNAHVFNLPTRTEDIPGNITQANERCLQCHSDLRGYQRLTDKKLLDQDMAHWFLPNKDKHFLSVRCVDCHSEAQGENVHVVMAVKETKVDCDNCHSKSSAMTNTLYKYRNEKRAYSMVKKGLFEDGELYAKNAELIAARMGQPDSALGFMNANLLSSRYITGITQTPWLNTTFIKLLAVILLLVFIHTAFRLSGKKAVSSHVSEKTIFPILVRIWHWINALLFLMLIYTGLAMHFGKGISFETAQSIHATFSLALAALWILYVLYLILTGQIMQYLPRADFIPASLKQVGYYMFGIYRGRENPAGHDPKKRLNPLQQISYIGILFLLFPALLASGAAMFIPDVIPAKLMGMDGKRFVWMVHTASAFLIVIFLVVHLYLCTTGETVFALIRSMFTGNLSKNTRVTYKRP